MATNRFIKSLRRLISEERGATAPLTAVFLVALIGMLGAAVDLGAVYSARGELQNAADAAALAAANTMVSWDANNVASAQPDTALANAQTYSAANHALGAAVNLREPLGDDFTIGFWDYQSGDFDPNRTGLGLNDPDSLTGVRVRVRRDDTANTPVRTFFSGIVGINQVNITATSTAFLGWAASTQPGQVDLPIAVDEWALNPTGDSPLCGKSIEWRDENMENGSWWAPFGEGHSDQTLRDYVSGDMQLPGLNVGDTIDLTNGTAANLFKLLSNRFGSEGLDTDGNGEVDYWEVVLPVYKHGANSGPSEIVGFATMVITAVHTAPVNNVEGYLKCGMVVPNSATGGGDFGSRATISRLVR